MKLSDEDLKALAKSVNNRCNFKQRTMARHFRVHRLTISRNLRRQTLVRVIRRRRAPKMNNEDQQKRARNYCGKLYSILLTGHDQILDDEKYPDRLKQRRKRPFFAW